MIIKIRKSEYRIFGHVLRDARLQARLTQQELAKRLDLPQSFVSKYETGERRIDLLELRRICAALNIGTEHVVHQTISMLDGSK